MNANELKRNENLCNQLDMNFEEANELFGKDTLSSMQMVRVNGGVLPIALGWGAFKVVCAVVGLVAGAITIYQCATSTNAPTEEEPSGGSDDPGDVDVVSDETGITATEEKTGKTEKSDTMYRYYPDGTYEKFINYSSFTPSP